VPWSSKRGTPADARRRAEYDSPEYRRARKALKAEHAAGRAFCWRCGRYIPPHMPRHTGHDDRDRTVIRGNECPSCNLSAAARKGAQAVNGARTTSRHWA
jgi:hypothetical protein